MRYLRSPQANALVVELRNQKTLQNEVQGVGCSVRVQVMLPPIENLYYIFIIIFYWGKIYELRVNNIKYSQNDRFI